MLRDFQQQAKADIFQAWAEKAINVMPVLPTGSGKTVLVGDIIKTLDQPTVAIAHRQELVGQLALALNREQVPHGLIASKKVVQQTIALEMKEHGYSSYNPRAATRVAGVDTLIRRDVSDQWFQQVKLAVIDEGHHVLRDNKWGRSLLMFPNAMGLFPTAHALRADGQGLGRSLQTADGLVDRLVIGPCGRDLINRGFLTDYRLVCPPSHLDLSRVAVGASGDFNQEQLRAAVHSDGALVGDVVATYCQFAYGKLGVTFAVDIDSAKDLAAGFRNAGIPAEVITGETDPVVRVNLLQKFKRREIIMLVSVDVLGEGVDVPAIEVVIMARPTASFQLYAQQFGRALRLMIETAYLLHWDAYSDLQRLQLIAASAKPKAIIIDHVGNWARFYEDHGFVDSQQAYTLNRRERSARNRERDPDYIPLRTCLGCFQPYPSVLAVCPLCQAPWVPAGRSKPDQVEGNLIELDPTVLAAMRGEVSVVDGPCPFPMNKGDVQLNSIHKNHRLRQEAQATLRDSIAVWAGWNLHQGRDDAEGYRRFYMKFGTDVLTAQTLNAKDATALETKIRADLAQHNIVGLYA